MEKARIFTVSEVNMYIKQIFDKDLFLSYIYVKGEISNLKIHSSGHAYFTLKDNASRIKCVMFRSSLSKIKFKPEEGLKVVVKGYFSIYERDGQYQLYADSLILEGTGELFKAYEQLKERLEKEGLFDDKLKKPLPFYPKRIAVITSPTGAAVRDIVSIVRRRNPNVNVLIYPVLVQGVKAPAEIAEGLNYINSLGGFDVIIMGRGGGSIEELWAFNEEIVARAIFNSKIPVVSAVGHETDFTISDFTADVRAATPSAAAELVVPEKQLLESQLQKVNSQLNINILSYIKTKKMELDRIINSYSFRSVETQIINLAQALESLKDGLTNSMKAYLKQNEVKLKQYIEKLNILNPASYLMRGYSYVKKEKDMSLITSVKQAKIGEEVRIFFKDGNVLTSIKSKYEGD